MQNINKKLNKTTFGIIQIFLENKGGVLFEVRF